MSIDWSTVFEQAYPRPGLPEREVRRRLNAALAPITEKEAAKFAKGQKNPFSQKLSPEAYNAWKPVNPLLWKMPSRPFPESFISFLTWSNGGGFKNGDRIFEMFGTDFRQVLIDGCGPELMPDAVPFCSDGGDEILYLFDMREPAQNGEYPIVCSRSFTSSWEDLYCVQVALGFEEFCRGRNRIEVLDRLNDLRFKSRFRSESEEEG